jgi:hypothetical protein
VIKIGSRREEFPVRESKCVGLLIMFVKPLIENIRQKLEWWWYYIVL